MDPCASIPVSLNIGGFILHNVSNCIEELFSHKIVAKMNGLAPNSFLVKLVTFLNKHLVQDFASGSHQPGWRNPQQRYVGETI